MGAVEAFHAMYTELAFVLREWWGGMVGGLPGHGEGRDDLVAARDRGYLASGLDYGADEFVAHYEACGGGLVAAVDVEFAGGWQGVRLGF